MLKEEDEAVQDQLSFVRKVLGIVAGQLLLTLGIALGASFNYDFGSFCASLGVQLTSIFVYLFSIIALMCPCPPKRGIRFQVPFNYILLMIFSAAMGFMIAGWTFYLTPASVVMSISVLAIVLSCIFLSALFTTNWAKALMCVIFGMFGALILLYIIMIPLLIAGAFEGIYILYCTIGILLASGLIYIDLFMIMAAGKYALDEYIFCALLLYLDIIRLFLYILMAFGKGK